ncbi:hypothetical protein NQ318_021049 [Aromia moschata]|uniref:pyridoxal 5'-phosphate synthase n=1 Tax=Aromia moschata TaxID=1265417 RepID=A0AAV8YAQ8_9CUCU|nr:hypothetical protein NQ318_021049 [Aromia moschata]
MCLSDTQGIEILILLGCGDKTRTQKQYPDRRISQSTVSRIENKFREFGNVTDISKSGRKRILDDEQKLDILLDIQDNLHKPTRQIVNSDPRTSKAMCLSTITKSNYIWSSGGSLGEAEEAVPPLDGGAAGRFVLMKGYNKTGFVFFTHYTSRKGQEIAGNPNVGLTFYWEYESRSVRIEDVAEKLPFSNADEYFATRPYESQIGSAASDQSKPITGRRVLTEKQDFFSPEKAKYPEGTTPAFKKKFNFRAGFIVIPHMIEFWQGHDDILHDRIRFRRLKENEPNGVLTHGAEDGGVYERLSP